MAISKANIGNALTSVAPDHVVAVANDIYDEVADKYQSVINAELDSRVAELERGGTGGGGATPEQVAQIEVNKNNIATLEESKRDNLRTGYTASFVPQPTVYNAAGAVIKNVASVYASPLPNVVLMRTPYTSTSHGGYTFDLELVAASQYESSTITPVQRLYISALASGRSLSYKWNGNTERPLAVRLLRDNDNRICFAIGSDDAANPMALFGSTSLSVGNILVSRNGEVEVLKEGWELRQGANLAAIMAQYGNTLDGDTVLKDSPSPSLPITGASWMNKNSAARYVQEMAPPLCGYYGSEANKDVYRVYAIALPRVIYSVVSQQRIKMTIEVMNYRTPYSWSFDVYFIVNTSSSTGEKTLAGVSTCESAESDIQEVSVGFMDERVCVFFRAKIYAGHIRIARIVYDHYNGTAVDLFSNANDFVIYDALDEAVYEGAVKKSPARLRLAANAVTNLANIEEE